MAWGCCMPVVQDAHAHAEVPLCMRNPMLSQPSTLHTSAVATMSFCGSLSSVCKSVVQWEWMRSMAQNNNYCLIAITKNRFYLQIEAMKYSTRSIKNRPVPNSKLDNDFYMLNLQSLTQTWQHKIEKDIILYRTLSIA